MDKEEVINNCLLFGKGFGSQGHSVSAYQNPSEATDPLSVILNIEVNIRVERSNTKRQGNLLKLPGISPCC